jgi:hypothetical protein
MSAIEIYASNNYTSQNQNDTCLCGQYNPNKEKECRDVLQDKCFIDTVQDREANRLFEKLVLDCKNDANVSFFDKIIFKLFF